MAPAEQPPSVAHPRPHPPHGGCATTVIRHHGHPSIREHPCATSEGRTGSGGNAAATHPRRPCSRSSRPDHGPSRGPAGRPPSRERRAAPACHRGIGRNRDGRPGGPSLGRNGGGDHGPRARADATSTVRGRRPVRPAPGSRGPAAAAGARRVPCRRGPGARPRSGMACAGRADPPPQPGTPRLDRRDARAAPHRAASRTGPTTEPDVTGLRRGRQHERQRTSRADQAADAALAHPRRSRQGAPASSPSRSPSRGSTSFSAAKSRPYRAEKTDTPAECSGSGTPRARPRHTVGHRPNGTSSVT